MKKINKTSLDCPFEAISKEKSKVAEKERGLNIDKVPTGPKLQG
jgi:hypothetical protein